jgi:hypothetical protein
MMSDDAYASALNGAIDAIVGANFAMVPETGPDGKPLKKSQKLAEILAKEWNAVVPEDELIAFIAWRLGLGQAVGTLDWSTARAGWKPTFRCLHPRYLEYRDSEERYIYEAKDGTKEATPGDGKWVLWGDRHSWQSSALCALGELFYGKRQTIRDNLRYLERHGLPIILAGVPAFDLDTESQAQFIADLEKLGSDTTLALPTHLNQEGAAYTADILEAKDQSYEAFKAFLERGDRKIQIFFAGSNAGSELTGSVGSLAASQDSSDGSKGIAANWSRRLSTVLREQIVKPWVGLAYDRDPAICPYPQYQVNPPDETAKFDGWSKLAGTVSAWTLAGYQIDNIVDLAGEMGLIISEAPKEETDATALPPSGSSDPKKPQANSDSGRPQDGQNDPSEPND